MGEDNIKVSGIFCAFESSSNLFSNGDLDLLQNIIKRNSRSKPILPIYLADVSDSFSKMK